MPGLTKEDLILEFVDRVISGEDLDRAALDALPKISMKMEPDDYPLLPSEWMVYTPAVMAYAREKLHLKDRMDVRLLELLIRVKRLRLQGIDEGEIRKQIHELALLDSWEIDAENDNYVRYFPLNRDDVIEWVDRLVFDTDDDQEEVGK
jgi:hypothetical protein